MDRKMLEQEMNSRSVTFLVVLHAASLTSR
jgi:hypothetical protein